MKTYNETLKQLKKGPWHEFLTTQSNLDAIVEEIDNEAQSKTIFPSPDDVFKVSKYLKLVPETLKSSFLDKILTTTSVKPMV